MEQGGEERPVGWRKAWFVDSALQDGELLDKVLVVNERHLRRILTIYLHHFNNARPHRTLAQLAPAQAETQPPPLINLADYQVRSRPILDGLTSEYQIAA